MSDLVLMKRGNYRCIHRCRCIIHGDEDLSRFIYRLVLLFFRWPNVLQFFERSSCYEVGSRVSRDRKSAVPKGGEEEEDRTKRTRLERFFCVAAPVIRSNSPPTTRADCFSFLSSLPVSRRPTFSIAQSVVYLAFISISHGPPPPPQPTEVLSSIPFLRTRVSRVAEQTWLKNYSSNYNYPETKLSRH